MFQKLTPTDTKINLMTDLKMYAKTKHNMKNRILHLRNYNIPYKFMASKRKAH